MLAVMIWGATPAATKYAVAGIDAFTVGMLRTVLAGLISAIVLPEAGKGRVWTQAIQDELALLCGMLQMTSTVGG